MTDIRWQIWADTGGTFTDCLAVDPLGVLHRTKVLSSSSIRGHVRARIGENKLAIEVPWELPDGFFRNGMLRLLKPDGGSAFVRDSWGSDQLVELDHDLREVEPGDRCEIRADMEAPILAAHLVTKTRLDGDLPSMDLRIATTRGTNALLERKGAPTGLFITAGFGDLLVIGHQQRSDLFALDIHQPSPFYTEAVEVKGRLAADGQVVEPLDEDAVQYSAMKLYAKGIRSAAIALLHSYRNPVHEERLAEILHQIGFTHISCSSELAPLIKLLPRAQTAVVDAYLSPILGRYLSDVAHHKGEGELHVMTSAGGLVRDSNFRAKDALLSGPAGGVVGAADAARRSGIDNLIAFDMGGTSTDVSRWNGEYEYVFEHSVGDAHLVAPALAIETVAAGGGSVCSFDGYQLKVGPESAGADPGPACYGAGGPLAVTDVNLLLGRIVPERFGIPVVQDASRERLDQVLESVRLRTGEEVPPTDALSGFLQIANERMAAAVRTISIQRGHDPSHAALVAFGGAGPQHACAVADLLDIKQVLIPQDASLLSAEGLRNAVVERFEQRQVLKLLEHCETQLGDWFAELGEHAKDAVAAEGVARNRIEVRRCLVNLRMEGQETSLTVEWNLHLDLANALAESYQAVYGYPPPERAIEVESVRVVASTSGGEKSNESMSASQGGSGFAIGRSSLYAGGRWLSAELFERSSLAIDSPVEGPALVLEPHCASVVEPGWTLNLDERSALKINRTNGVDK
ncbi:MAG: hydantoinase/oxoprolinase family protein [bacterium]|nr:hydantoinase/oxoprolinase family protein [bacterium]